MIHRFTNWLLNFIDRRIIPSELAERGSLAYWREMIAFAILLIGMAVATLVMIPSLNLTLKEHARGMTILNLVGYGGGWVLLFNRRAGYEYRALYILLMHYLIGLGVMLSFGPMSGGPAWLFAFAVLSGVLLGVTGAFVALGINTATLAIYGWVYSGGLFKPAFPYFSSVDNALVGLVNFIMVNAVAATAVAVLVRGLGAAQAKEKRLISDLEQEKSRLYQTTRDLEYEIRERVQAEEHLKGALSEKEILLREIHHRVKNNLQIVNSLLSLQTNQSTSEEVTEAYRSTMSRVRAMASVHEALYRSDTLTEIDLQQYLTMLTGQCLSLFGARAKNVVVEVKTEGVVLTIEQATPCGLIVNELLTNALKYAFPGDRPGRVSIDGHDFGNGEIVLEVRDDGSGLAEGFDWRLAKSMGLSLVRILSEGQLHGTLELDRTAGTCFRIKFKRAS